MPEKNAKAAMTYDQSATLMQDFAFRGRVKVAGLHYATYIQSEEITTPAHSARYRWAQMMAQQPEAEAMRLQPMVVMDDAVQGAGAEIDDAALQSAVENVINKFL